MVKIFKKIASLVWNLRPFSSFCIRCRSINILDAHNIKVILTGELPKGPCILVSNHLSYFDPLIISSYITNTPIAKLETASWPLFGRCMKKAGVIFYERNNPWSGFKVLKQASTKLLLKNNVLVFPEGTTSAGEEVLPFKRGIFGLSKLLNIPIVPITLYYNHKDCAWWRDQDNFFNHYLQQTKKNDIIVRMHVGEKQTSSKIETAEHFASYIRKIISQELSNFKD